jgi:hypothetical protein
MKLSLRWKLVLGSLLVEIVMLSFLVTNSLRLNEAHLQQLAGLRLREVSAAECFARTFSGTAGLRFCYRSFSSEPQSRRYYVFSAV